MSHEPCSHIPSFTGSFRENLEALIAVLEHGDKDPAGKRIGFELERILIDDQGRTVPFAGEHGVGALLAELARSRSESELVYIDGHLLGSTIHSTASSRPWA